MNSKDTKQQPAMRKIVFTFLLALNLVVVYGQKFGGLAPTPPMGWNTWNKFHCDIDENLIKASADAMVSSGLKDAGYLYIVIDDCWHGERDSLGFIHPNPKTFPSGMKALADYVHSKGLKLGIYSDAGNTTCGHRPGSRGHEYQDALTYASWGIDYLKYDWCDTEGINPIGAYTTMRDALHAAKRPILFSMCEWGNGKPWEWAKDIGHMWRTTGDIWACFDCKKDQGGWFSWGVLQILDMQDGLRKYAGPEHWNDPDMMEVGNGMTTGEDRAHFSMWCMLAAPLMTGNDIANMTTETQAILTNKEAIAIDQDRLGVQGYRYSVADSVETWYKPLENGDWAVTFLNRGKTPRRISYDWLKNEWQDDLSNKETSFGKSVYKLRDVWQKKDLMATKKSPQTTKQLFNATLPGHDVIMLRLLKQ
jgi:alpha-galactosidase